MTMTTFQFLTVAEVKARAREYYDRGLLTAQAKDRADRQCFYKQNNYRCAIGAALNEDVLEDNRCHGSVSYLYNNDLIDSDDIGILSQIQTAHDNWCTQTTRKQNKYWKSKFLRLIEHKDAFMEAA